MGEGARRRRLAFSIGLLAACGSCSPGPAPGPVSSLVIVSGNDQTGPVGQPLGEAVAVRVADSAGQPIQGQVVGFQVTSGGGSVFAGSAASDAAGIARERWTVGTTPGPQELEARLVTADVEAAGLVVTFRATAVPGPAQAIVVRGPSAWPPWPGPAAILARVSDAYGNAVTGASVTFTVSAGGGTALPGLVPTNESGEAVAAWTFGPMVTTQSVEAQAANLPPVRLEHEVTQIDLSFGGYYAGTIARTSGTGFAGDTSYMSCSGAISATVVGEAIVFQGGEAGSLTGTQPPWVPPGDCFYASSLLTKADFSGCLMRDDTGRVTATGTMRNTSPAAACTGDWSMIRQ